MRLGSGLCPRLDTIFADHTALSPLPDSLLEKWPTSSGLPHSRDPGAGVRGGQPAAGSRSVVDHPLERRTGARGHLRARLRAGLSVASRRHAIRAGRGVRAATDCTPTRTGPTPWSASTSPSRRRAPRSGSLIAAGPKRMGTIGRRVTAGRCIFECCAAIWNSGRPSRTTSGSTFDIGDAGRHMKPLTLIATALAVVALSSVPGTSLPDVRAGLPARALAQPRLDDRRGAQRRPARRLVPRLRRADGRRCRRPRRAAEEGREGVERAVPARRHAGLSRHERDDVHRSAAAAVAPVADDPGQRVAHGADEIQDLVRLPARRSAALGDERGAARHARRRVQDDRRSRAGSAGRRVPRRRRSRPRSTWRS